MSYKPQSLDWGSWPDNEESSVSQLLSNISLEDIRVATQILNYAEDIFNTKVSDSKVIALSDHIHSALERYNLF